MGAIFRNTRPGTAFEARRHGVSDDTEYELFHICRSVGCKFSATKRKAADYLSFDKKTRIAKNVSRFAFTDKTDAVIPWVDIPCPVQVARVYDAPRKIVVGLIVVILAAILRIKHALSNIDISQAASNAISFVLRAIMANVFARFHRRSTV